MTDGACKKWFAKLHARDFFLDDAPWLGRPVEVDSNQIETLFENNQLYHVGDSRHTQNIQINNVIGENEKCLLFYGINYMDFLSNPICIHIFPFSHLIFSI